MASRMEIVGFRCNVDKLDYICKVTGLTRSKLLQDLVEEKFIALNDDKAKELFSQLKNIQAQLEKFEKTISE